MTLKLDVRDLPPEAVEALERGETVEFEEAGRVVGTLRGEQDTWKAYFAERSADPPLDYDDYLADLDAIRKELNKPVEAPRWP